MISYCPNFSEDSSPSLPEISNSSNPRDIPQLVTNDPTNASKPINDK